MRTTTSRSKNPLRASHGMFMVLAGALLAASASAQCLERWDLSVGDPWFGQSLQGTVYAFAHFDPDGPTGPQPERLIAGGSFPLNNSAGNIAQWDGNGWVSLGNGANATVHALALFDEDGDGPGLPKLFAGGQFAGKGADQHIGRWDGTSWTTVGGGINGPVYTLHVHDPDGKGPQDAVLVAGGTFILAGSATVTNLAQWDGTSWGDLGGGVSGPDVWANALATLPDGGLLVGGHFTSAGGTPVQNIARWDAGGGWSAMGVTPDGFVTDLAVLPDGSPVLSGAFDSPGGPIFSVARWNGSTWVELGGGTNSYVNALAVSPGSGDLYVGGFFTSVGEGGGGGGEVPANRIARWSSTNQTWSPVGCGTNAPVRALVFPAMGALAVGGDFNVAGNQVAFSVAEWSETIAVNNPLADQISIPWTIDLGIETELPHVVSHYFGNGLITHDHPLTLVSVDGVGKPNPSQPCAAGFYQSATHDRGEDYGIFITFGETVPWRTEVNFPGGRCSFDSTASMTPGFQAPGSPGISSNLSLCVGSRAKFASTVYSLDLRPAQLVWSRNNIPLVDGPTGTGSIVTTSLSESGHATLLIENVSPADAGAYTCTVTNPCGSATSNPATLTVLSEEECEDRIARFDLATTGDIVINGFSSYDENCDSIPGTNTATKPDVSEYLIFRSGGTSSGPIGPPTGPPPPPPVSLAIAYAEAAIQKSGPNTLISLRVQGVDESYHPPDGSLLGQGSIRASAGSLGVDSSPPLVFRLEQPADWAMSDFYAQVHRVDDPARTPINTSGSQLAPGLYAIEFAFNQAYNSSDQFFGWQMNLTPSAALFTDQSYLSFDDSPYKDMTFEYFHLEDFEDGAFNTPGVSEPNGWIAGPTPLTDSVDGDDGAIDGSGNGGTSWYFNPGSSLTFTFEEAVLGRLPTHAGLALTDMGTHGGFGQVMLEALDCLGNVVLTNGPHWFGDGVDTGLTQEDRFLGFQYEPGIKQLRITMVNGALAFEIDHLQYGSTEPIACASDIAPATPDGVVGIADLLAVIGNWGPCPGTCEPTPCGEPQCDVDTNGDCTIGIADLLAVIGAWGSC